VTAPNAGGTFTTAVPLSEGNNTITAVATSIGGATATTSIQVTLDTTPPHLSILSPPVGVDTSDATVNVSGLVNDIVVGTVNDQQAQVTVNGIAAQVSNRSFLAMNVPLNLGANTIQVTARDRVGNAATASMTINRVSSMQIRVVSGNAQSGLIQTALPTPLVVEVRDAQGNLAVNKTVVFKVTGNDGTMLATAGTGTGKGSIVVTTDGQGRAQAYWTLGSRSGAGSNRAEATSPGVVGAALFNATGIASAAAKILVDSGLNQTGAAGDLLPLPFVAVVTDAGNNRLAGVPVTFTVTSGGGTLNGNSNLSLVKFDITTVAGQTNTIGMPIFLPVLDQINKLCVTPTTGGTLVLPSSPGFSLTVTAGSASFPGGSKTGCISVTPVHIDKSPMTPGFGQQPRFLVTIQPVGTTFNPPAAISIPNVDGLRPRTITELYSYDHDLASFVSIGTGQVSSDGFSIISSPGVGVMKAGWHCGGNPNSTGTVSTLRLDVNPTTIGVLPGQIFSVDASGSPAGDASYEWNSGAEVISAPPCENLPSCKGTFKAPSSKGQLIINVTFICHTTGDQVTKRVNVYIDDVIPLIRSDDDFDKGSRRTFGIGEVITLSSRDPKSGSEPVSGYQWKMLSGSDIAVLSAPNANGEGTLQILDKPGTVSLQLESAAAPGDGPIELLHVIEPSGLVGELVSSIGVTYSGVLVYLTFYFTPNTVSFYNLESKESRGDLATNTIYPPHTTVGNSFAGAYKVIPGKGTPAYDDGASAQFMYPYTLGDYYTYTYPVCYRLKGSTKDSKVLTIVTQHGQILATYPFAYVSLTKQNIGPFTNADFPITGAKDAAPVPGGHPFSGSANPTDPCYVK
jgi:hypothetical protein